MTKVSIFVVSSDAQYQYSTHLSEQELWSFDHRTDKYPHRDKYHRFVRSDSLLNKFLSIVSKSTDLPQSNFVDLVSTVRPALIDHVFNYAHPTDPVSYGSDVLNYVFICGPYDGSRSFTRFVVSHTQPLSPSDIKELLEYVQVRHSQYEF